MLNRKDEDHFILIYFSFKPQACCSLAALLSHHPLKYETVVKEKLFNLLKAYANAS